MREAWTDDRLDYLNRRVDDGFKQVDERFEGVDRHLAQIDKRLERLEDSMQAWQRSILQLGGAGIVTMLVGFLTVLSTTL